MAETLTITEIPIEANELILKGLSACSHLLRCFGIKGHIRMPGFAAVEKVNLYFLRDLDENVICVTYMCL